ncbi:MAG: hypothetical protein HY372_03795 [Candidatus Andersenbacteria bacterium]|nr:hypothetical protein [Candidatus Andersenbacteria bacterium]
MTMLSLLVLGAKRWQIGQPRPTALQLSLPRGTTLFEEFGNPAFSRITKVENTRIDEEEFTLHTPPGWTRVGLDAIGYRGDPTYRYFRYDDDDGNFFQVSSWRDSDGGGPSGDYAWYAIPNFSGDGVVVIKDEADNCRIGEREFPVCPVGDGKLIITTWWPVHFGDRSYRFFFGNLSRETDVDQAVFRLILDSFKPKGRQNFEELRTM